MSDLKEYRGDFVLLVEAGFVAVSHLDEDAATKLFNAAQILDPHHSAPRLGLAAIALHKLDLKKSNEILEEIAQREPENHRANALLGISYLLSNKDVTKGEELLHTAMTKADDPATRRLGELWLEVLEKGVRKTTSPLQPQKKKAQKAKAKP
jgi:thioredoxin-like negative regulator of GroEL